MALFGKKKRTLEEVAAELKKPVWWVSRSVAKSTPSNTRTKKNITRIFGEKIDEQTFDTIYSESKSPLHEQKAIYEATPTLVAHELAREIIPYLIVKKTGNKYTKEIGRAVMIAIENSLKRREETPEAIDEERFAGDVVRHLSKHFIIKDPEKTKRDLVKVLRAIKDYSSTLLSIDPIEEEQKANVAHTHLEADIDEPESSDSYLEKNAPEVFEKWWKLKTTIAEVLGTKPYRHEIKKKTKTASKKKTAGRRGTKKESTKIITQKIPSEVEETFKTLKNLGVDLKLETGNVAERKAKIYAWMVQNGLIHVEQDGEKVRIVPTEKMHQLIAKHGKAAGAILKWAAEEGVGLEHVEPVGKIVSALEELRQIAKKKDPALARTLEKAMKSKHTMKELYYLLQGHYAPEDLSERWSEQFGRVDFYRLFEQYPELAKATLTAMEEMEKKGLTEPPVPKYWIQLLRDLREGKVDRKKVEEYLAFTTYGKHVFNSLHSIAGEELPENGEEVEALIRNVMAHNRGVAEAILARMGVSEEAKAKGMEYLERNMEQLAQIIAHMKDPDHLDRVEGKIAPILEKLPAEGRRIGLFKREKSPREKVEEFAGQVVNVIRAGAREEDIQELFKQAAKLKEELQKHIGEREADRLVRMITAPAIAEMWKRRLDGKDPAKEYVKIVAQDNLHRFIGLEPKLKEIRRTMPTGRDAMKVHDDLVKHLTTWELPGTMAEREPFLKRIRTKEALKNIAERHYR